MAIDNLVRDNIFEKLDEKLKISIIANAQKDEAFYSSIIEGANTTKQRTNEMVDKKILPKNKDEKMVLNNYFSFIYILENLHTEITEDKILDIYKIVTKNTFDDENQTDGYREGQNYVRCMQEVIYISLNVQNVIRMINDLVKFKTKKI